MGAGMDFAGATCGNVGNPMRATAREVLEGPPDRVQALPPEGIAQLMAALVAACRSLTMACDALARAMGSASRSVTW
jgi:hypothetical protein